MLVTNQRPPMKYKRIITQMQCKNSGTDKGCTFVTGTTLYDNDNPKYYQVNSWLSGSEYKPLAPITKSDGHKPTAWKWSTMEIDTPPFPFKYVEARPHIIENPNFNGYKNVKTVREFEGGVLAIGLTDLKLPSAPGNNEKNDAMLKAQASIRRAAGSLPMMLAERKATAKTIKSYSVAILNNVITMQRRDVKRWLKALKRHRNNKQRLAKISKDIANRHLEFVFGVMPLIDDIMGLTETFTTSRGTHRTGRGRQTHRTTDVWRSKSGNETRTTTLDRSVRVALRYKISNSVLNDASLLGFNPIYSWYDFTPLSFIVGFFSNMNTFLQTLDPVPGLMFEHGYATHGRKVTIYRSVKSTSGKENWFEGEGVGKGVYFVGERFPILQEPGLHPPRIKDNYGVFAATASASLLIQRLVSDAQREITRKPFRLKRQRAPRNLPPIKYVKVV